MSDPTLENEPIDDLREERERRERGLEPKTRIKSEDSSSFLVILEDDDGNYHCHRYVMEFGRGFDCSYDAQGVDIDTAFKWLNDPRAL